MSSSQPTTSVHPDLVRVVMKSIHNICTTASSSDSHLDSIDDESIDIGMLLPDRSPYLAILGSLVSDDETDTSEEALCDVVQYYKNMLKDFTELKKPLVYDLSVEIFKEHDDDDNSQHTQNVELFKIALLLLGRLTIMNKDMAVQLQSSLDFEEERKLIVALNWYTDESLENNNWRILSEFDQFVEDDAFSEVPPMFCDVEDTDDSEMILEHAVAQAVNRNTPTCVVSVQSPSDECAVGAAGDTNKTRCVTPPLQQNANHPPTTSGDEGTQLTVTPKIDKNAFNVPVAMSMPKARPGPSRSATTSPSLWPAPTEPLPRRVSMFAAPGAAAAAHAQRLQFTSSKTSVVKQRGPRASVSSDTGSVTTLGGAGTVSSSGSPLQDWVDSPKTARVRMIECNKTIKHLRTARTTLANDLHNTQKQLEDTKAKLEQRTNELRERAERAESKVANFEQLMVRLDKVEKQLEVTRAEKEKLLARVQQKTSAFAQLQEDADQRAFEQRTEIEDLTAEVAKLKQNNKQLKDLTDENDRKAELIQQLQDEHTRMTRDLVEMNERYAADVHSYQQQLTENQRQYQKTISDKEEQYLLDCQDQHQLRSQLNAQTEKCKSLEHTVSQLQQQKKSVSDQLLSAHSLLAARDSEIQRLHSELETITADRDYQSAEHDKQMMVNSQLTAKCAQMGIVTQQLTNTVSTLKREATQQSNERKTIEVELTAVKDEKNTLRSLMAKIEGEQRRLANDYNEETKKLRQQLHESRESNASQQQKLVALQSESQMNADCVQELEQKLQSTCQQLVEAQRSVVKEQATVAALTTDVQTRLSQIDKLSSDNETATINVQALRETVAEKEAIIERVQLESAEKTKQCKSLKADLAEKDCAINELNTEHQQFVSQMSQLSERLDSFENELSAMTDQMQLHHQCLYDVVVDVVPDEKRPVNVTDVSTTELITLLAAEHENISVRQACLLRDIEELKVEHETRMSELHEQRRMNEELQQENAALTSDVGDMMQHFDQHAEEVSKWQKELTDREATIQTLQSDMLAVGGVRDSLLAERNELQDKLDKLTMHPPMSVPKKMSNITTSTPLGSSSARPMKATNNNNYLPLPYAYHDIPEESSEPSVLEDLDVIPSSDSRIHHTALCPPKQVLFPQSSQFGSPKVYVVPERARSASQDDADELRHPFLAAPISPHQQSSSSTNTTDKKDAYWRFEPRAPIASPEEPDPTPTRDRLSELARRNQNQPPHLVTSYPLETMSLDGASPRLKSNTLPRSRATPKVKVHGTDGKVMKENQPPPSTSNVKKTRRFTTNLFSRVVSPTFVRKAKSKSNKDLDSSDEHRAKIHNSAAPTSKGFLSKGRRQSQLNTSVSSKAPLMGSSSNSGSSHS